MQPLLPLGVRVPGSSANLGPGFDTFGLALDIALEARIYPASSGRPLVRCTGANSEGVVLDESNLVLRAFRRVFDHAGRPAPAVCLDLRNEIPLARGLGSSGAAIIAGIELADQCARLELSRQAKLTLAAELEQGHADNVGASLLGGFVVVAVHAGVVRAVSLAWPQEIGLLAAIPATVLPTHEARSALPAAYERNDAVFNVQRAALLAALLAGAPAEPRSAAELELVSLALADRLHQPYRARLVPGLKEALEMRVPGLLGVTLSGAGPSLLAFVSSNHNAVAAALAGVFAELGVPCAVRPLCVSAEGAREIEV